MNPHGLRAAAQLSPIRINAAGAQDAHGPGIAPASLIVDAHRGSSRPGEGAGLRLHAIGTPEEIDRDPVARNARVVAMPRTVILPGFVNSHTHLDLTHIGPRPHDPALGFMTWVEMIRAGRGADAEAVRASVRRGIELSRSAGVVAVGDIAGAPGSSPGRASLVPWQTMHEMGMDGVSFLEFFAIGTGRDRFRQWLPELLAHADKERANRGPAGTNQGARIGLQPHAPNTVCIEAYRWAVAEAERRGLSIATHVAESPEERMFIGEASGPMRGLLDRLGLWDKSIEVEAGRGLSPVAHLAAALGGAGALLAHVNDASDADIERLAEMGCTVVYCPHASEYFGAAEHFGPHRYRDMLAAGINVALGTDSLVNLSAAAARTPAEGGTGMSILEEMRLLWKRDGTEGRTLLAMGTLNGTLALGLAEATGLAMGDLVGELVGVEIDEARETAGREPVDWALGATNPAQLLFD